MAKPRHYPFRDKAVTVATCDRICFNGQKINLSQVFAGQTSASKAAVAADHSWPSPDDGRHDGNGK